ncbi:C-type mannose receptor 2-like [Poeciliopsis prolifica]|uniref:C-type mannose receptor 2-like n=1 Tax=Poeciliopsis prolifica TaxID=188132 RepID=UPI0024146834|nr:C-type mannose receptor 2-like [Poeciliopsis prolifica]
MQWCVFFLTVMAQNYLTACQLYEFHYINENKTWTEAQQYCREKHTDLVTVTNMKDMKRLINISDGDIKEAWIGLYDQTHGTRTWYWSLPGVEFNQSETNWNPGEPNNYGSEGENCGIIWKEANPSFKWGDLSCNEKKNFICYDENNSSQKYHLIYESMNWTEAQSYCREKHTDLISGLKQLKDGEVNKGLKFTAVNSMYIFTGLFSDTWRWSDGSNFSFRHWNLQFNNQRKNSGQCAMTVFDNGGRWRNENCTERKPFICNDDDSSLILIKVNKTWEGALTYCRDHHHDLVTITDSDEQRLVQQKAQFASTPFVWMGLRYACTLDLWFWVSDEVVSYKNWAKDEPMDDCDMSGAMETGGGYKWSKKNDLEEFNFICFK